MQVGLAGFSRLSKHKKPALKMPYYEICDRIFLIPLYKINEDQLLDIVENVRANIEDYSVDDVLKELIRRGELYIEIKIYNILF